MRREFTIAEHRARLCSERRSLAESERAVRRLLDKWNLKGAVMKVYVLLIMSNPAEDPELSDIGVGAVPDDEGGEGRGASPHPRD
jgi:hypothetical protein